MGQRKGNVTQVGHTVDKRSVWNLWDFDAACLERISCFNSKLTAGGKARKEVSELPLLKAKINYSLSR